MLIAPLSDFHLEHSPDWSPPELPRHDVAVFAGDIDGSIVRSLRTIHGIRGVWPERTIFVPGNHEGYGNVVEDDLAEGRELAQRLGIHLLAPGCTVLEGVRFVGATMWTDYRLDGKPRKSMAAAAIGMNDHRLIRTRSHPAAPPRSFTTHDALALHLRDRSFVEGILRTPFEGPTVVVTHHCPHPGSVHPSFRSDPINPSFASDLEETMRLGVDLWIHGHTHVSLDYRVGRTRVVCNPKGYGPRVGGRPMENQAFDPGLVVEIGVPRI